MKAAFAAGCFWGVEARFKELGVDTTVGYMGDDQVETVLIEYNPKKVSYEKLLDFFWKVHDYTRVNRQGPNIGVQYRSEIFYFDEDQKKKAESSKPKDATTKISKVSKFTPAEDYHQNYFDKHKTYGQICHTLKLD